LFVFRASRIKSRGLSVLIAQTIWQPKLASCAMILPG